MAKTWIKIHFVYLKDKNFYLKKGYIYFSEYMRV